jgi:hypothetical protein
MSSKLTIRTIGPENLTEFNDGDYLVRSVERNKHYHIPAKPLTKELKPEDWTIVKKGERYRVPIMRINPERASIPCGLRFMFDFEDHFMRRLDYLSEDGSHVYDYDVYLLQVGEVVEGIGIVAISQ